MKCSECEYFKILHKPFGYECGSAKCKKYDLVVDFISKQKLDKLTCVKENENEQ